MDLPAVRHEIGVELSPERAFALFNELGAWWPLAYTFSGAKFDSAHIEPRAGGRWFERSETGDEIPWGEVRVYEHGRRLVLQWGIGPDRKPAPPARSSEVEVRFAPADAAARVSVEHRDFERHGEGAELLRQGMDSDAQGWPLILAEFRRAARQLLA